MTNQLDTAQLIQTVDAYQVAEHTDDVKLKKMHDENYNQYYSPELGSLHDSNRSFLDWGRVNPEARKLRQLRKRLNTRSLGDLTQVTVLDSLTKHDIWVETPEELNQRGFSDFGICFYKLLKRSVASRPVTTMDFKLALNDDPVINSRMMSALYLWANEQIVEEFEQNPIKEMSDTLLFLRGLTQRGLVFLHPNTPIDDETVQKIKEDNMLHYFDIDILGQAGKMERLTIDMGRAKRYLIATFPEYVSELEEISNLQFNHIVCAQVGRSLRDKLINFNRTLKDTQNNANNYSLADDMNDNIFNNHNPDSNSVGMSALLDETLAIDTIRFRVHSNHNNDEYVYESNIHNANLRPASRTGLDWLGLSAPDSEPLMTCETVKDLADVFQIGGVQWGAAVNGINERAEWFKLISESFMDMSHILNINPHEMGLPHEGNGLGIAIATNGVKNSAAHYSDRNHYLHLNRINSVGSMAHEWFHAYDAFLFKKAVQEKILPKEAWNKVQNHGSYVTSYFKLLHAFVNLPDYQSHEKYEQIKAFDPHLLSLAEAISERKNVQLDNDEKGRNFVNDINNYANPERLLNEFEVVLDSSLSQHKTLGRNLNVLFNLLDYVSGAPKDKIMEEAKIYWQEQQPLNYKLDSFLLQTNMLVSRLLNQDISWFVQKVPVDNDNENTYLFQNPNAQIFKTRDGSKYAYIFDLTTFIENKDEYAMQIANHLKDYRENVLSPSNVVKMRNEIRETLSQLETKMYQEWMTDERMQKMQAGVQDVKNNTDGKPVNLNSILTRMYDDEFQQHVKGSVANMLAESLLKMAHPVTQEPIRAFIDPFFYGATQHISYIETVAQDLMMQRMTQDLHKISLDMDMPIPLGKRMTNFVANSLIADGKTHVTDYYGYYSLPHELFARMGETLVARRLQDAGLENTFLSNVHNIIANGSNLYPMLEEQQILLPHLEQSLQVHCRPFGMDVKHIPVVVNEYQKQISHDGNENELECDDDNHRNSLKIS